MRDEGWAGLQVCLADKRVKAHPSSARGGLRVLVRAWSPRPSGSPPGPVPCTLPLPHRRPARTHLNVRHFVRVLRAQLRRVLLHRLQLCLELCLLLGSGLWGGVSARRLARAGRTSTKGSAAPPMLEGQAMLQGGALGL